MDQLNSVIIFLCRTFLHLAFLLGSLTLTLTVLPFWVWLFLSTLAYVLLWLSLYREILIMLLSQFPLTFLGAWKLKGVCFSFLQKGIILLLIWMVFRIIWEMFHDRILLKPDSASYIYIYIIIIVVLTLGVNLKWMGVVGTFMHIICFLTRIFVRALVSIV